MTHDPKRIEAAARALHDAFSQARGDWDDKAEGARLHWVDEARRLADVLYPELSSDPPSAWLAPWEATATIRDTIWGAVIPLPEDSQEAAEIDVWADVRDAHTKEQT